jgi:hypothetical protein
LSKNPSSPGSPKLKAEWAICAAIATSASTWAAIRTARPRLESDRLGINRAAWESD